MRSLLLACVLALAVPATAGAATTIGSTGGNLTSGAASGETLMSLGAGWQAPSAGVITAFSASVVTGGNAGSMTLKVVRDEPAGSPKPYRIVGQAMGALPAGTPNGLFTVAGGVRLPVTTGDHIAIRSAGINGFEGVFNGGSTTRGTEDPAPGAQWTPSGSTISSTIAYSARLEPDADGDGYGDESQDACPGVKALQAAPCGGLAVALSAAPAAVTRGDVTTLAVSAPGADAAASATVVLPAGLQLLVGGGAAGPCTADGSTVTCPLGTAGAGRAAWLAVRAVAAGAQPVTASVPSIGPADDPADNAAATVVSVSDAVSSEAAVVPGAKLCRVPRLTRHSRGAAIRRLKVAGCAAPRLKGPRGRRARVARQSIPAGTRVAAGTRVRLTTRVPKRR